MFNLFSSRGKWYRGNLHTHTTESDGRLPRKEAVKYYAENGYDFIALTDHGIVLEPDWNGDVPITVIPGVEFSRYDKATGESYHIVGMGYEDKPENDVEHTPQETVDAILRAGGIPILAHPSWSGHTTADLIKIDGALGLEVFNSVCESMIGKGLSSCQWDRLLERGNKLFGFAVDDAHGPHDEWFGGWIMLKSEDDSPHSILESIRAGRVYSTSGTVIENIETDTKTISVRSSPCRCIKFIADRTKGKKKKSSTGEPITEAVYEIRGDELFIRIECVGMDGTCAWTNAIFKDDFL